MSIKTATVNGVATIEIARPEKKNALTMVMYTAMAEALRAAQADATVRAVLITGQPGIFTSGNDLEDFLQRPPQGMDSPVFQFMLALLECEKPVVAAVTGAAIGIGTTMLLHCDFVYVSDEARLAMPFVGLGLVPEYGSSWAVPQLVGHVKAAEKLLLGDPFTGAEAAEWGFANAVLPAGEVVNHHGHCLRIPRHLADGAQRGSGHGCAQGRCGVRMRQIGHGPPQERHSPQADHHAALHRKCHRCRRDDRRLNECRLASAGCGARNGCAAHH